MKDTEDLRKRLIAVLENQITQLEEDGEDEILSRDKTSTLKTCWELLNSVQDDVANKPDNTVKKTLSKLETKSGKELKAMLKELERASS